MTDSTTPPSPEALESLRQTSLLDAVLHRRSRRFGLGMEIASQPLAFHSHKTPVPLSEYEEGAIAFAACGYTGPTVSDINYGEAYDGSMMSGLRARTVGSADAGASVSLVVVSERGTFLVPRPSEVDFETFQEGVRLNHELRFDEAYRLIRLQISDKPLHPSTLPIRNIPMNTWDVYHPGTTYFIPINDITFLYINAALTFLSPQMGAFFLDERRMFRPAGLGPFAKSRGGWLDDSIPKGVSEENWTVGTLQLWEATVCDIIGVEQGLMHQNMALMCQALGLGGFSNFAGNPFAWFKALQFDNVTMGAGKYFGAGWFMQLMFRLVGKDVPVDVPVGLTVGGRSLLRPYCPPNFPNMDAAVDAVVAVKQNPRTGILRGGATEGDWKDPQAFQQYAAPVSSQAITATKALCNYVYDTYGRFPGYSAPVATITGFQATHLDVDFYDRYYRPGVLTPGIREHLRVWHPDESPAPGPESKNQP